MADGNFSAARQLLEEVVSRWPKALWPRVILSHALLQQGGDLAAAEQALHDVLALDSGHTEARHNLALVRKQRTRPPDERVMLSPALGNV